MKTSNRTSLGLKPRLPSATSSVSAASNRTSFGIETDRKSLWGDKK